VNRRPRFAIAASPGFIAAVLLLLINDHVLKPAFPGVVTGKLSDVSGLFVAGVLVVALVPSRAALALGGVAAGFVLWKSPLSQPLIDAWNAVGPFPIARVVDWTDLLALAVLPLALRYSRSAAGVLPTAVTRTALLGLAAAAVIATSKAPRPTPFPSPVARFYPQATFTTGLSVANAIQHLQTGGLDVDPTFTSGDDIRTRVQCGVDDSPSRALVAATVRMEARGDGTAIVLTSLAFCRQFAPPTRDEMLAAFQREVLAALPDARLAQ
jgi:hypothetical protein